MMCDTMSSQPTHQFYRHPALPAAELRISRQSPHSYRLHMHAEYSLGIVDQGQALFQHAGGCETLRPGSVVMIKPGAWHACNPEQVTHWSYRMLYVQAEWLNNLLGVAGLCFTQRVAHDATLSQAIDQLCQPWTSGHTEAWIAQLAQLLGARHIAQPFTATSSSDAIAQALHQLHQHPDDAPSVQALAQAQGMTSSRFIRHFKAATGVTPGAYRLNLRLNGARRLLAQGLPLAEAAHAMGFADQAHLQRSFKAHHALTPGRYAQGLPPLSARSCKPL